MYNVSQKCIERILRAKNEVSSKFEKSFFEQTKLALGSFGKSFSKNRQKSLSPTIETPISVV